MGNTSEPVGKSPFGKFIASLTPWSVASILAIVGAIDIALPMMAWKREISPEWFLRLLAVICSWPVAALVLVAVLLPRFEVPLVAFLTRMTRISAGSVSAEAGQQPLAAGALSLGEAHDSASAKKVDAPAGPTPAAPAIAPPTTESPTTTTVAPTTEAPKASAAALAAPLGDPTAVSWKYLFLNQFLVPKTKRVLVWLMDRDQVTFADFMDAWQWELRTDAERAATLQALASVALIETMDNSLHVTVEGRQFVDEARVRIQVGTPIKPMGQLDAALAAAAVPRMGAPRPSMIPPPGSVPGDDPPGF